MEIIKRSGLLIPKQYQYEDFYIKIREFLQRRVKAYNSSIYTVNTFYIESEKFLLLPRNFPIQKFMFDYNIKDISHEGEIIDIEHNITPRSDVQKKAINHIMQNENATLQLAPGVGKTVISIYMIAERKRKSLILVHRDPLAVQWKNRIEEFTNLKGDEISRLSSATFESDLDKPIIISTVEPTTPLAAR